MTDSAGSIQTSAVQPSEVRTFLIADVRGYTRFTLEHGDEAAARLAQHFAQLTEAAVTQRDGRVIELRGDEALAVFSSARQALRAAVELQTRFAQEANDLLPLRVGIGLDAGEAIPVEGGYRGAALNLAARLCTLAGPGEVLASDTVANLARKIEGVEYAERGLVELKGFADRVRVMQVVSGAEPAVESEEATRERNAALSSTVEQSLPIGGFLGSLPSGSLVGRNAELARILSAVDAVGGGEGRLIMLAGEPGIGKTRLAQEVTLHLRNRSFLVAESIRSAIGERLSRLDDEVQEVLHEASVLGQTFRFDDLERMSGRDERALEEALEKAAEAGLLREAGRDNYGFNHALTQQTLYAEVSSRRRRRLHLAAGEALEQLLKRARETRPAEVAWHFLEGDDAERALPYAILAGDQAEAVFAHTEAEEHYRTALDLAEGLGDEAREVEVREKLGGLLTAAIRYPEALEMLERTAQIYQARGDQESEARVVAQVGRVHLAAGSIEVGIDRLQTALHALSEGGSSSALAGLNSSLARCLYVRGRYDDALAAAEQAIHMAAAMEAGGVLAESEVTRGAALAMLGQWSAGLGALSEAVDTAERVDDVFSACRAKQHISCVYLARGELEAGRQHMERALTLAERMNNRRQIATAIFGLSVIAFLAGERDVSQGYAERSLQLIQDLGGFWLPILHAAGLSLALAPGQWESASPELKECIDIIEAAGALPGWRKRQLLAARDLEEGRPDEAREQLIATLQDSGMEWEQAVPLEQLLAWAHLETGEEAQAEDLIRRGLERAAAETLRMRKADWLRIQAMLLAQQERWTEAESALDEALSLVRSMPYPYGEARLLYQSGVMRLRRGESAPAREQLAEALAIFQRLGAERDVERARQVLLNARTL